MSWPLEKSVGPPLLVMKRALPSTLIWTPSTSQVSSLDLIAGEATSDRSSLYENTELYEQDFTSPTYGRTASYE